MQIRALTIILVKTEEKEPPAFSLVGNLTPQEAYSILHDFMLQEARRQGQEEVKAAGTPKKKRMPSVGLPTHQEGGSEG